MKQKSNQILKFIKKLCKKFNAKPEECIIFEDSLIGIEAAKQAGIETIAIYDKYSDADTKAIKAQADFYLHNYTELLSSIDEL